MNIKNRVALSILAVSSMHYAKEYADMSIIDNSSVHQSKQTATLEQAYTKKLNALRHELTNFKTSRMLYDNEVHTMNLNTIEKRFHALNREIQGKELVPQFSFRFAQELAGVERELFDTRALIGKPENMMDIVE